MLLLSSILILAGAPTGGDELAQVIASGFRQSLKPVIGPNGEHHSLKRAADGAAMMVSWHIAKSAATKAIKNFTQSHFGAASGQPSQSSISGIPLGDAYFSNTSEGARSQEAIAGRFICRIRVLYKPTRREPPVTWSAGQAEADSILLERFVREKLGKDLGASFEDFRPVIVHGTSCQDTLKSDSGVVYVRMQEWVHAYGYTVTVNPATLAMDLVGNNRNLRFVMLAKSYRKGSEWRPMLGNTYPVLRDGNWYVPLDAMEASIRN